MEDYCIGELFYKNDIFYNKLKRKIDLNADIVQFEHPWLYRFIKRVMEEESWHPKLIYSSHNIEYKLKNDILKNYRTDNEAEIDSKLIYDLEIEAINNADGIICVSESDLNYINSHNHKNTILARNGVSDWIKNENQNNLAKIISKESKFALYCASGHPPNIAGFFNMFGGGFGSLTPDQNLIIAGGAGNAIAGNQKVHESAKLAEKIITAGIVPQETLWGLLNMAHCIVLPLTQGGGTNLKTAEALWSGKYILATSIAMRGFESFISEPGVFIEDDPANFKRTLRDIMGKTSLTLTEDNIKKRSSVLWKECLSGLPLFIEKLQRLENNND